MTKASASDIKNVYNILSVQSMIDIKYNFGRVDLDILNNLNEKCYKSFILSGWNILCGICYIFDTGESYNMIIYTTGKFIQLRGECHYLIKTELNLLKNKDVNVIVYKGANQLLATLYSVGFTPTERGKNNFKILEIKKHE